MTQSSCKRDTKSKSRPGMKLAPVQVFSCKHHLTHAHNLHVKMLDFAPFTICTLRSAYCLRAYFAQTILTNHLLF